ncbi:adenosylcobinamide kinase /adenosylcobinamide-phosphate guanylyltransferase [Clostridium sp. DSM 8431]|uniref:bifunctional adenosylcobinamide kinase/adenosylcobinamide-phosphate guanylyltransferase n=1 Tax=Clostridium sp. DSM 8431 TaxID=1761781 RepID=UPI0008ECACC7|nr:bifunctional adenosylcobinamide kinase/adenosylcobinamide-phosphate guanylyltransferase [Clostridium sp. DSM 8431]SFU46698.1 adenosylcobinamide kinase /adenosylcobinamide-phosphate guanylyltransferase [Clostridium sp. DSM 8431]
MIFVIGGKYNNKLNFVLEEYNLKQDEVYFGENEEEYKGERVIYNFHEFNRKLLKEGKTIEQIIAFLEEILKKEDLIIISDEVGYGIVPIEKDDRIFREAHGRISCFVALKAKEVYRVMYGTALKIKG